MKKGTVYNKPEHAGKYMEFTQFQEAASEQKQHIDLAGRG